MKRTISKKRIVCATNGEVARAKKQLYTKLHSALDALDTYYSLLKDEYSSELNSCYEELEILVRELDSDINPV